MFVAAAHCQTLLTPRCCATAVKIDRQGAPRRNNNRKMGRKPCPGCHKIRKRKPKVRGGLCNPCRWLQTRGEPLPQPPSVSARAARTPLPLHNKTKSATPAVFGQGNVSSNSVAEDAAAAEAAEAAELASRTQPHSLLLRNNKRRRRSLSGTRRLCKSYRRLRFAMLLCSYTVSPC